MASRGAPVVRPVWMKQAEEAKLKDEEQKAAAARAAFDATFNDLETPPGTLAEEASDSDTDESRKLASKPIGPADPGKCTAAGTGVAGGAAGAAASFVIVTKDSDNRRVPHGGAHIKVRVTPGVGVGGVEQEALVKDHGDGTYTVTYAVAKRGDYMVSVECNGLPILNSPFPVFFSGGNAPLANGLLPSSAAILGSSAFGTGVGQSLTPFTGVASGLFPGMLGMIPGVLPGATGGAILPGLGASLGEVCRDYLNGRCARGDCKYNHPPQAQLMAALAAGSTMGGLSQMPMPPSAAAMAAAQSIAAAQAYQAAQVRAAAQESSASKEGESSPDDKQKEAISRTVQVSNLNPMLTSDQLKTLFSFCGTVSDCQIAETKQLAYVEYAKPDEAKAALALNNMEVGGRPINVDMAKSVPSKKSSSVSSVPAANGLQPPPLPVMMQQAVAMQQLQFQQALLMQQAMAAQQAAVKAATVKSASEMATARAAEISKTLKVDGEEQEEKDTSCARSPSRSRVRSLSRSRSPIRYRRDRHSRSRSRSPIRYRRAHQLESRSKDHFRNRSQNRDRGRFYRRREDYHLLYSRHRWERDRERENDSTSSRRSRSGSRSKNRSHHHSRSPRSRKDRSHSPEKVRKESLPSGHRSLRSRSPPKEVRPSRSPVKGGHRSVAHNEKFTEKNDIEKERRMSPTLRKDDQTINEQLRYPKSPPKGVSPMKASPRRYSQSPPKGVSPRKASVQIINEMMSSRVKFDADSMMVEGDGRPKKSPAHVNYVSESVQVLDHVDKFEEAYHKERRRKKKDDDHHKHDKKRKRHKHRRHRSPSDSQDGMPSLEDGKSKPGSDDSASIKRSHKKKTKPSRSMSISSTASE